MRTKLLSGVLVVALAFGTSGCIKKMMLNGQIAATRKGSGAANTIGDYELARSATSAGLLQFEGMHRLAPDNEDALFMLTKGWTGYGYAFVQDDYEAAVLAGELEEAEYQKKRAKLAFDRAISYGLELLAKEDEGFEAARKNADTIKAWLAENFDDEEDAEPLFWVGSAWLARVNLMKDDDFEAGKYIGELFIGVAMLEQSRKLDPEYMHWNATNLLAAYHARAHMAELDQAKKMFELALAKTGRKHLGVQLNYATRYACATADRALYEKLLNEVLASVDPDPELRLLNTIAKRRAKRALSPDAMEAARENCGFPDEPEPAEPTEDSAEPVAPAPAETTPAAEPAKPETAPAPKPETAPAPKPEAKPAAKPEASKDPAKPATKPAKPAAKAPAGKAAKPAKPAAKPAPAAPGH